MGRQTKACLHFCGGSGSDRSQHYGMCEIEHSGQFGDDHVLPSRLFLLVNFDYQIRVEPRVLVQAIFRVPTWIADDPRSVDHIVEGIVGMAVDP